MKIALLSDIHANWQALEAVMRDCPKVDETICLGDVVGYGGDPKKCVDEVTSQGWLTLVGNHDRACTDPEILEDYLSPALRARPRPRRERPPGGSRAASRSWSRPRSGARP